MIGRIKQFRRKVTLLLMATVFVALALTALGLVLIDLRTYEQQATRDLETQADVLARATAPALQFDDRKACAEDLSTLRVRPGLVAAAVYARDGSLFASYARADSQATFPAAPEAIGHRVAGGHLTVTRPIVEKSEKLGTMYLQAQYDPWTHLREYLAFLLIVMLVAMVLAAIVSNWLQLGVTDPVLDIAQVARDVVTRRDYSLRARKTTEDEIGTLVDAFNEMVGEAGRREEQLRENDRRKDEFLATLAHELRNPLAPIRTGLEILRMRGDDPEASRKAREMMRRQVSHMVRLIDDLLDVSRITTGKLEIRREPVPLQAVIRDAIETARPMIDAQGHTLEVDMPGDALTVEADATRLAQVVSNLLHNAAKYTPREGRIELHVRRRDGEAEIRVSDNGIGIATEMLPHIFDMFVQADRTLERTQAGLGVGLTLARRFVELHGGTLTADSEGLGQGSEFTVRIPLYAARSSGKREGVASSAVSGRHRVLLADDNPDFVDSMAELLAADGHDVRVARDGAEAVEMARDFQPEFAFVDIAMPRLNGYDVAQELRRQLHRCVLIAVTGWGQLHDRERAREAGFDRHLVKPVDPTEVRSILAVSPSFPS